MTSGTASSANEIYQAGTELYILLKGRVVLEDCESLRRSIVPRIAPPVETVFVDLATVDYVDSAGLGLLVGFKMTTKKNNARMIMLQPTKTVADILYISKLDGIFEFMSGKEAQSVRDRLAALPNRSDAESNTPSNNTSGEWIKSRADTGFPDIRPEGTTASAELNDRESVEEYCRLAVEQMRQGNYELSIEEYRKALGVDPNYLPALNNLAIVYEKQPSWAPQAIEQWEKVLELSRERGDQKHADRAERHLDSLRRMQN